MGQTVARAKDSLFAQGSVPGDAQGILAEFDAVISSCYPLTSKQRAALPDQVRGLSHLLTDEREARHLGYMNSTQTLSAYTHYFLWWNLVRLTRLFANLDDSFFALNDGDFCADLGSGPLTVPIAMLLARPELRVKRLTWYCLDVSQQALTVGENLFLAVASRLGCEPWGIVRVRGELGTPLRQKARLVTCANLFNEVLQKETMPPDFLAKRYCEKLLSYAVRGTSRLLVVEPGVPACGRFVSLLRDAFVRRQFVPVSPCPHCGPCPMDGKRGGKWCNYVFGAQDAPQALRRLSQDAHLAKERAVLSFVAVMDGIAGQQKSGGPFTFRVASDSIRLPGRRQGFYACSSAGLLLVVTSAALSSGECYSIAALPRDLPVDKKTGALVVTLD